MNYEINEAEFYAVEKITQIDKYQTTIEEGEYIGGFFKTKLIILLGYFDDELRQLEKKIILPIELNFESNDKVSIELNNLDIEVIDNQGININYSLGIVTEEKEIVEFAFDQSTDLAENIDLVQTTEIVKESVVESYEELIENQLCRNSENINVNEIDNEEFNHLNLVCDMKKIRIIFNVSMDEMDSIALKYNLSVAECLKMISSDKSKVFIPFESDSI